MTIVLVALGLLPFTLGGLLNWLLMSSSYVLPPVVLAAVALVALLAWSALAYTVKPYIKNRRKVVLSLHIVPLFILILLGIQELILHGYWMNFLGLLTQLYYLPLLNLCSALTRWWNPSLFSSYCVAFLLMVAASIIGCRLRKK